jgi:hypothetical protein
MNVAVRPTRLKVTFDVRNIDDGDRAYLEGRKQAIDTALNELSFPRDGSKPATQLGVHGASVHVIFDHKNRHAAIDVRGPQCTSGCTIGTVASARSIHKYFQDVVVRNRVVQTFAVSVGGQTIEQLKRRHGLTA